MGVHYELPFTNQKIENLIGRMNCFLKKIRADHVDYNQWEIEACTLQDKMAKMQVDENKLIECLVQAACKTKSNKSNIKKEKDEEEDDSKLPAKQQLRRSPRNHK